MIGKVLSFADYMGATDVHSKELPDCNRDAFLLEEGLGLLASYRSIHDRVMRLKIKALVEMIARSQVQG